MTTYKYKPVKGKNLKSLYIKIQKAGSKGYQVANIDTFNCTALLEKPVIKEIEITIPVEEEEAIAYGEGHYEDDPWAYAEVGIDDDEGICAEEEEEPPANRLLFQFTHTLDNVSPSSIMDLFSSLKHALNTFFESTKLRQDALYELFHLVDAVNPNTKK